MPSQRVVIRAVENIIADTIFARLAGPVAAANSQALTVIQPDVEVSLLLFQNVWNPP
jgi:hypothetical protein